MEYGEGHGLMEEELVAVTSDSWEANLNIPLEIMNHQHLYTNGWGAAAAAAATNFLDDSFPLPTEEILQEFPLPVFFDQPYQTAALNCSDVQFLYTEPPDTDPAIGHYSPSILPMPNTESASSSTREDEYYSSLSTLMMADHHREGGGGFHGGGVGPAHEYSGTPCKMEPETPGIVFAEEIDDGVKMIHAGTGARTRKPGGGPSKNLMAERRRRKRLNDRLSMLRSVVPKISKMDRTSILGDTIDYMKELIERINKMQEEIEVGGTSSNLMSAIFKEVKPNDLLVRNSPKFAVERRKTDTRIEICCAGKPGLLLSTVGTLESLGLEIQQCVISCFNDFALQASCSEGLEQRGLLSAEDIKQALFKNAGYGGKCL